ncbi:serine hydrolase domain-containing protein [Halopiger xanaduensis]|uniref:Beta-lactamase n=1 Tax=Halopiger xanaduensis (strain DSM 18323 / JCM 14033 / SH-6) TaxID=797210 RepID=F8D379_HALXS|nr:serine hydrolase domain-containing protein [Halopiger xanaduensis]AEH38511.1 beta-lactamase [Halopiger xanaduensis SH-6]
MSKRMPRRRILTGSAALGATALAGSPARIAGREPAAETATQPEPPTDPATVSEPSSRTGQSDAVDLEGVESFVDDRLGSLLETHDVVGASVAVVHDGAVELAKGYGESDREAGTPVDADETAFRIGSVSKPLVWTAAMQLIEDGRLDPDEPVEPSLESVSIPDTYDEPITMAHLATHTAGFEDRSQGTWVDDPDDLRSLPNVLREEQPERVRPPGEIASYSNYGAALAAQVVADVTSTSFQEYVSEHLFDPLGMDHTTFEQPAPEDIDVASGYTMATGSVRDSSELFLEIAPAGAATATASDMARFMRAHLEGGAADGERILASEAVDRMHEQWFTHHETLPGIAFGFVEDERDGVRILEHDGAIPGSSNGYLVLVPEYDLGLFLATNTDSGRTATGEFVDAFLEEYLPEPESESDDSASEPTGPPAHADALEGTYRGVRIAETTHSRLATTLQAGSVEVSVDEAGFLVTDFGGGPERWVERADDPLVFDAVDGDETLAFRERAGEITHLFLGFHAFERVSWHESLSVHGRVAGLSALGMLSGAVGWPLARAKRRLVGGSDAETETETKAASASQKARSDDRPTSVDGGASATGSNSMSERGSLSTLEGDAVTSALSESRARWIVGGAIACLFGFVVGFVVLGVVFQPTLLSDPPLAYDLVSLLPILGALGTLASIGCTVVAWREGYWGRFWRVHYTLVVASAVAFCWLLYYWNFLRLPL